jgi:ceramide glucosyltransferase
MALLSTLATLIGFALLAAALLYSVANGIALLVWRLSTPPPPDERLPPVTVLKPLCGAEPRLYEDLKSFCVQEYPQFQLVIGVRDASDPAHAVARRLAAEFPAVPIAIVVDPRLHGSNCKVSNLINMLPLARHDILVMADSDVCVEPHYLRAVAPALCNPGVGLVTCIYQGMPTSGIWSRVGAMYVNEWYMPSILLAWLFGHQGYVSGQTVCIRQTTLRDLGGLEALANHLADDHELGTLVRMLGLKIELSRYVVAGAHHEPSFDAVLRHEIRWMRTLRVLRPVSFRWLFLTFSLPLAAAGLALVQTANPVAGGFVAPARLLFAATLALRLMVHGANRLTTRRNLVGDLWLLPLRDLLLCWVWLRCFFTSTVTWRGNEFDVDADGIMRRL